MGKKRDPYWKKEKKKKGNDPKWENTAGGKGILTHCLGRHEVYEERGAIAKRKESPGKKIPHCSSERKEVDARSAKGGRRKIQSALRKRRSPRNLLKLATAKKKKKKKT